jgi:hypothetical protein
MANGGWLHCTLNLGEAMYDITYRKCLAARRVFIESLILRVAKTHRKQDVICKAMTRASTDSDIELQLNANEYLDGFADVSEYIGSDRELALFRRFDVLGARNLLYLQARLLGLEELLREYDEEDKAFIRRNCKVNEEKEITPSEAALDALQVAKDWATFSSRAKTDSSSNGLAKDHYRKRMETVLEIQAVLKQYRTYISQTSLMS